VIDGIEEDLGAIRDIIEEMDTARATPLPSSATGATCRTTSTTSSTRS
jgi:hypothetical protein